MAGKVALVLGFVLVVFLQHAAGKTVHVVGDAAGWAVQPGGAAFYTTWAAGKKFVVGDSLVFNFTTGLQEVERVLKRSFDLCDDDDEIGETIEVGPATIVLSTAGEHYFISDKDRQCEQGLKLAINVTAAPGGATPPPSSNAPRPPTAAPVEHVVGDAAGWAVQPGGAAFYVTWAAGKTFKVGDSLVFNFTTGVQEVERVPKRSFDLCSDDDEIGETIEVGPATIVLSTTGEHYFISDKDRQCEQGLKLAINVTDAPRGATPPSSNAPRPPAAAPVMHVVGDAAGWAVQPSGAAFYVAWASRRTFAAGDSLVFNFTTGQQEVERVPKRSFDLCDDDDEIGETMEVSPATVVLSTPGEYYFISDKDRQCEEGLKLAINVSATRTSITNPPSNAPGGSPSGGGSGTQVNFPSGSSSRAAVGTFSLALFGLVLSLF